MENQQDADAIEELASGVLCQNVAPFRQRICSRKSKLLQSILPREAEAVVLYSTSPAM